MLLKNKLNIRTNHTLKRKRECPRYCTGMIPSVFKSPLPFYNYNKNKAWEITEFIDNDNIIPVISIYEDVRVGKSTMSGKDKYMCEPDGLKRSRSIIGYNHSTNNFQKVGQYISPTFSRKPAQNTNIVWIEVPNFNYRLIQKDYNGNCHQKNKQFKKQRERHSKRKELKSTPYNLSL